MLSAAAMMNDDSGAAHASTQPQSADTVMEPQQDKQLGTMIHNGPIEGEPPSSCLGDVVPSYEPLKACLDDDTSIEDSDDDEFDDDDFFFGDDEDIDSMAVDYFGKQNSSLAAGSSSTKRMTCHVPMPVQQLAPSTSAPSLTAVADEGSSVSSSSLTTDSGSLRGYHSYSTGAMSQTSLSSSKSGKRKSRRRVSIHNDVAVVPIPSREEYSGQIKERLWSSGAELYQNAARNSIEFAAEGWNWRNVTEDESMLVHTVSGELIHPIHLHNALQMNASAMSDKTSAAAQLPVVPNTASVGAVASPSQTASA